MRFGLCNNYHYNYNFTNYDDDYDGYNTSIDKVKLRLNREYINEDMVHLIGSGVNIGFIGRNAFINIHGECFNRCSSILHQILNIILQVDMIGVFSNEISYIIRRNFIFLANFDHTHNKMSVFDIIGSIFTISEIEIAFDFDDNSNWEIIDSSKFIYFGSTTYSRNDYQSQNYKNTKFNKKTNYKNQRSLVCIYDHAVCHDHTTPKHRLELRFCGKYVSMWKLAKLNHNISDLLKFQTYNIARKLRGAIKPSDIVFNLNEIEKVNKECYTILRAWQKLEKKTKLNDTSNKLI